MTPFSTRFSSIIDSVGSIDHSLAEAVEAALPALEHIKLSAAFLVLHEQVELKLTVTETVLEASGLEAGIGIAEQQVGLGFGQSEGLTLGFVLKVDMLQFFVHHLGKGIGLLLGDGFVLELEVEMVARLLDIGKAHEELGRYAGLLLGLMNGLDELGFVELLARHGDDTVDLGDHMDGRRIVVVATHLDEVVHIVAIQAGIGRHVRAIAFAQLQLVDLQEVLARAVQFALLDKLVVVKLREQHGVVLVVKRETEAALGSNIAQLLVVGLLPVEGVHVLVHVYLGVAAFPGAEVLEPRPEVARLQFAFLLEDTPQLFGPLRTGLHIGLQFFADQVGNLEVFGQRTTLDIGDQFVGILGDGAQQFEDGRGVGRCPERDVTVLHSQTHERIVARRIVAYRHDAGGGGVMLLDNRRYVAHQHAADRTVYRAVGCIALQLLTHRGEDMSAEDTTAVLDEVPGPDMRHLAIHILQVLMGHRDPLGRRGRTGGGGIHIGFAGEEHILLAVHMFLYVRTQGLKTLVDRHIHAVEAEEVFAGSSREDTLEMVLTTIDGILGKSEYVAQRFLGCLTGAATPFAKTDSLRTAHQHQHRVDKPRIRQRPTLSVHIRLDSFTHVTWYLLISGAKVQKKIDTRKGMSIFLLFKLKKA